MTDDLTPEHGVTDDAIERVRVAIFIGFAATGMAPDWEHCVDRWLMATGMIAAT